MFNLQELIKDACEYVGDDGAIEFRNSYSGRGMYGRECVGVVGSFETCQALIAQVIKDLSSRLTGAARDSKDPESSKTDEDLADVEYEFDQAVDKLLSYRFDNMGLQMIFYWPDLDPLEEEEPEDDGQPDEAQEWHDFDPDC